MTQQPKPAKTESFEKNLERLDAIIQQLEDADLPLEKALQLYEEGMKLSEVCHKQLEEAEGRV
jgi:exodeoxyribonuclease VII small subunit